MPLYVTQNCNGFDASLLVMVMNRVTMPKLIFIGFGAAGAMEDVNHGSAEDWNSAAYPAPPCGLPRGICHLTLHERISLRTRSMRSLRLKTSRNSSSSMALPSGIMKAPGVEGSDTMSQQMSWKSSCTT